MASQQPISIIGAGIGGLTLGRCLLKHKIPAVLYEKMPSNPRHGYAITLYRSSYQPLLKILNMDERSFKRLVAVDGSIGGTGLINQKSLVQRNISSTSSFRAHRGRLEELLRDGLDVRWEHALERVANKTENQLSMYFRGGQKVDSHFVIGVDGPHSNTRKSLLPETDVNVLPFVAFNGKRRVTRDVFEKIYAPAFKESSIIEVKRKDVVLSISVNDQTPDQVSISWVYSRPSQGPTDTLYNPNRSVSSATDIPVDFFVEVESLGNLEQPFKEVFNGKTLRQDRVLHWLMRTTSVDLSELQELARKGVYFLGDSIHAEPIIGGDGANTAMKDAISLAECIAKHGQAGIPEWYEFQYESWRDGVAKSEKTIAEIHAGSGPFL